MEPRGMFYSMRPNVHKTLARGSGDKHSRSQTCLALPDPTVHVSVAENMAACHTKRLSSVRVVIRVLYKCLTVVYCFTSTTRQRS